MICRPEPGGADQAITKVIDSHAQAARHVGENGQLRLGITPGDGTQILLTLDDQRSVTNVEASGFAGS